MPEDYWQVRATVRDGGGRAVHRPLAQGLEQPAQGGRGGRAHRRRGQRRRRPRRVGRAEADRRAVAAALRPDDAAARGEPALRLHRQPHAAGGAGATTTSTRSSPIPRTSSRYLSSDLFSSLRSIARPRRRAPTRRTRAGARYVPGLDVLPLDRVVNDAKVTDHHAIIPTDDAARRCRACRSDERRIYDLVARRFLAVFHPDGPLRADDGRRPRPAASASARAARC